ncbi:DUF7289 family protein [Natronosalvus amylolyticus]|uniref:DUF7289 family protein n=1 Tax=Natronosalvus amylolyticus TaxID=2961994 RepID=UPI0020C9AD6E|nr:hypothetical protein [Natronosalvus amylolyticus]
MTRPRITPDWATETASRGLVPLLALTLLIGFVAAASIGILLVGTDMMGSTSDQANDERVEQSFAQLNAELNTVAASRDDSRTVELGLGDLDGDVKAETTGHLTITASGLEDPLVDEPMQSIVYQEGETSVAYESGAVFRGTGEETWLVSGPQAEYRDGSFTLPITRLSGIDSVSNDRISLSKTGSDSVTRNGPNLDGQIVTITIQSQYYAGWAAHFEREVGSDAVTVYDESQTVKVVLGQPKVDGTYDSAIVAQGDVICNGNRGVDGPISATGTIDAECDGNTSDASVTPRSLTNDIAFLFETEGPDAKPLEGSEIDNGTYITEDLDRTDDLTLDVSDGDVTLLVEGNIALHQGASIDVVGANETDNVARVYTTGDVGIANGGGGVTVDSGDPGQFQLYGTSDMKFAIGQASFTGTVYAPRSDPAEGPNAAVVDHGLSSADCSPSAEWADVCIGTGQGDFTGSIVSGPIQLGQSASITYDETLETVEPTIEISPENLPPELNYFNVVIHDVELEG